MKIELKTDVSHGMHNWVKGAIVTVTEKLGNELVRKKKALMLDDSPIEREAPPVEEEEKPEAA